MSADEVGHLRTYLASVHRSGHLVVGRILSELAPTAGYGSIPGRAG